MTDPTEMDPSQEPYQAHHSSSRSRRTGHSSSSSTPPTYGYHNTFHTHAQPVLDAPPSYATATSARTLHQLHARAAAEVDALRSHPTPPPYTCSVELGGILGFKNELSSPFQLAGSRQWDDVYVSLRGTQLNIHRIKSPHFLSKSRTPGPGRRIKTFTLQHAEVGIAADFKKTRLVPKSPFAHLVPGQARQKLYETDPHLFEPVREHAIRLRLETQQFLLCASTPEEMLEWVEMLCMAIDISSPLEHRSEPRYRSLPRRNRRQRILDGSRLAGNLENLSSMEAGRRIIAEQERILRQLYPHLAGTTHQEAPEAGHTQSTDAELDDFDPDDVRFPTRRPQSSESRTASQEGEERPLSSGTNTSDPKFAPRFRHTPSQALRYRRRCAPILLASSPRVSDVVYSNGERMRINVKEHKLIDYHLHPPRYESHSFPKSKPKPKKADDHHPKPAAISIPIPIPTVSELERPASPLRGVSDDSITFGYDLASTSSDPPSSDSRSAGASEPPSPTALGQAKADAERQLATLGKRMDSRETRLSAVALGAGLLI